MLITAFVGQFKGKRFIVDTYTKKDFESLDEAFEEVVNALKSKLKFETTILKSTENHIIFKGEKANHKFYFLFNVGPLNAKGASLILWKYKDT